MTTVVTVTDHADLRCDVKIDRSSFTPAVIVRLSDRRGINNEVTLILNGIALAEQIADDIRFALEDHKTEVANESL